MTLLCLSREPSLVIIVISASHSLNQKMMSMSFNANVILALPFGSGYFAVDGNLPSETILP